MRFLTPALLLAGAGYVHWYNAGHTDSVLLFPFIDYVLLLHPSTKGNHAAMGAASVKLLAALGVLSLLLQLKSGSRRGDQISSD